MIHRKDIYNTIWQKPLEKNDPYLNISAILYVVLHSPFFFSLHGNKSNSFGRAQFFHERINSLFDDEFLAQILYWPHFNPSLSQKLTRLPNQTSILRLKHLLFSTEFIIQSFNIIFFDVIPVLDLDDLKRNNAWVFQTVLYGDGNECAFIRMDIKNLFSLRHPRCSRNDHPMLTSMMMNLKA